jgi:uncharacterized protein YciI
MKKIFLFMLLVIAGTRIFAQAADSTQKTWLGVLTLTEKYKDEKNWTPSEQAVVGEHFQRLIKYKNEGKVFLAGRTELATDNPDMMGLVIFFAKDEKEALQFMLDDPAVKQNIMKTKVHPYGLALSKCR